jgi:hypothetical protein
MSKENKHGFFSGTYIANLKDILLMVVVGVLIVSYVFVKNLIQGNVAEQAPNTVVNNALFSISISILLYAVFRVMFRYLNTYYPWLNSIGKRLRIQIVLVIFISASIMAIFNWI